MAPYNTKELNRNITKEQWREIYRVVRQCRNSPRRFLNFFIPTPNWFRLIVLERKA